MGNVASESEEYPSSEEEEEEDELDGVRAFRALRRQFLVPLEGENTVQRGHLHLLTVTLMDSMRYLHQHYKYFPSGERALLLLGLTLSMLHFMRFERVPKTPWRTEFVTEFLYTSHEMWWALVERAKRRGLNPQVVPSPDLHRMHHELTELYRHHRDAEHTRQVLQRSMEALAHASQYYDAERVQFDSLPENFDMLVDPHESKLRRKRELQQQKVNV